MVRSVEDFDKQLSAILNGAVVKIKANTEKLAKKRAARLAQTVKEASPVGKGDRKGHYKDGWSSKKTYSAVDTFEYEVRNTKKYQLTHLLEHGHIAANGVRVGVRPHINRNAEAEINAFIEDVKEHCTDDT